MRYREAIRTKFAEEIAGVGQRRPGSGYRQRAQTKYRKREHYAEIKVKRREDPHCAPEIEMPEVDISGSVQFFQQQRSYEITGKNKEDPNAELAQVQWVRAVQVTTEVANQN